MKQFGFYLYQIYVWCFLAPVGLLISFIAGWLTVLVAVLFNSRVASRYVAANWGRILGWITPMFVTVEGKENADPSRTYVVVLNHQSQYDIFLVYGWLNLDLKWVMKEELRKVPGIGPGCEKAGHIFVDRSNPEKARQAVTEALDRVGDGVGILFFAEGSRSLDGKLKAFKKGAFRTAVSQQLPILPVTIDGTRNIQPPRALTIRPGRVRLVIHPAIEVKGDDASDIRDLMVQTHTAIASALPENLR
jgi:1-acyl-sn-glycerol-3-phosphate acyltransferase